jgi:hypothetical protein
MISPPAGDRLPPPLRLGEVPEGNWNDFHLSFFDCCDASLFGWSDNW